MWINVAVVVRDRMSFYDGKDNSIIVLCVECVVIVMKGIGS